MELECDHTFRHPPCLGCDSNGASVTKASGVYTKSMVMMIASAIAKNSGHAEVVKTISNECHFAHASTSNAYNDSPSFELATSSSYLSGSKMLKAHAPPPKLGGTAYTHLYMDGIGAQRNMLGVRVNEVFNLSNGTAHISVPDQNGVSVAHDTVPINHLRPYVSELDGALWTDDNPSDVNHKLMLCCSEVGCNK